MALSVSTCSRFLLGLSLTACSNPGADTAAVSKDIQATAASISTPLVVEIREAMETIAPTPVETPAAQAQPSYVVHPEAVGLILSFEIINEAYYTRKLQGLIVPSDSSGPTWGVGYDGGMQTKYRILSDWATHPDVDRLSAASGLTGTKAREYVGTVRDIRVPFTMAYSVYAFTVLPAYADLAKRTFYKSWDRQRPRVQGALTNLVYFRGGSTMGPRRTEMRVIRDDCDVDTECIATQILSMPRIWVGKPEYRGLLRRCVETAALVRKI